MKSWGRLVTRLCCGLALLISALPAYARASVTICVENTEFPPFNYFDRDQSVEPRSIGYDIDILNLAFGQSVLSHRVIALPWNRCLKEVKQGTVDAAMSASLNGERRRDYLISAPYYYLTPSYYYLKTDFPKGVQVQHLGQLIDYGNVCGIKNFNYENFGLTPDFHLFQIRSLAHLPEMLTKKRCQFFLARKETLSGTLAINKMDSFYALLAGIAVPDAKPEPFYMLISKNSPHKEAIKQLFDAKVDSLNKEGKLQPLLEHHLQLLSQAY
ncbi:substrate-binding periplasmic protein [Shewanella insulae]|uniref:substrate-binding periplasmic protein n=1 Tax=Shewanella insulae TaxID=2681496 RepID=UPI00247FD083|nr:transporter substrate-binding domain-containing protein [Shewanella insulae]